MSCWRNCQCVLKNVDRDLLRQAAEKMGLGINENVKSVGSSYGDYESNRATVDGAFTQNGRTLQLGYVLKGHDGVLNVVGDFWGTGIDADTFIGTLGQIYTELNIQAQAVLQGFTVESVTTTAEGDTQIEIYAWA